MQGGSATISGLATVSNCSRSCKIWAGEGCFLCHTTDFCVNREHAHLINTLQNLRAEPTPRVLKLYRTLRCEVITFPLLVKYLRLIPLDVASGAVLLARSLYLHATVLCFFITVELKS